MAAGAGPHPPVAARRIGDARDREAGALICLYGDVKVTALSVWRSVISLIRLLASATVVTVPISSDQTDPACKKVFLCVSTAFVSAASRRPVHHT